MSEQSAIVQSVRRHLSPIWIVPLAALLLGMWLAIDAYLSQGPMVEIRFENADGIEVDKTLVKIRSVDIGVVTRVVLAEDLKGVIVTMQLVPEARPLLREDSQFWVVKAQVRGASVTGLGTLLSGAYVEMSPGLGAATGKRRFVGLERAPATPVGTPGIRLRLVSESSGSVGENSPILYQGYRVGAVETVDLDLESQQVLYTIFVDAPYDRLISSNTRFWNASGISAELSTEGIKLSIGSLQSALSGGVSFALPRESGVGATVAADTTFRLYPDEASIHENPYRHSIDYVVMFERSLRGLHPGAPVSYRGIRIGSVVRIMLADLNTDPSETGRALPVLIRLEPGRMALEDAEESLEIARQTIEIGVERGLRITLETGNLLTGALYMEMDYHEDVDPQSLGRFLDYLTIPSIPSGLNRLPAQVSALLDKLNDLPIEGTLQAAEQTIEELRGTLVAVRRMAESESMQQLPISLEATLLELSRVLSSYSADSGFQVELKRALVELKQTLQSIQAVTGRLADQPNAVVFPSKSPPDLEPEANP